MRRKVILSALVILVVIAASLGATMAWFTDQSDPVENVFTAGTVSIDAGEQWFYGDNALENWNPGDCTPKFVNVHYTGSKRAFLRMQIVETWSDVDGQSAAESTYAHDFENIKWFTYKGNQQISDIYNESDGQWKLPNPYTTFKDWADNSSDWEEFDLTGDWLDGGDDWWYYTGGTENDPNFQTTINGDTIGAIKPPDLTAAPQFLGDPIARVDATGNPVPFYLVGAVCLDGLKTGNEYQGATYTMSFVFQAIQASHNDAWNWDNVDFETGLE
jgi:predicted ribosomally synthesized peptide with SipW-like signal peptide